jgi:hypothetical protein
VKSSTYRYAFAVVRIFVAALIVAAIAAQLIRTLGNSSKSGLSHPFLITNFFSFFTIDSNVISVVVLLIGAILVLAKRNDPRWYSVLRVIAVTYMAVTGVVYNLLLRGVELPQGTTVLWSNEVLHVVACAYLVLDWILAPGRPALSWRTLRAIVVFPIVWAIYTLIRAPFTPGENHGKDWYPYPFLNPSLANEGYFSVFFYVVLIAGVVSGAGAAAIWVSRRWTGSQKGAVAA